MKILFYDIEVAPIIGATWGLYEQNLRYENVIQDSFIICASWQWDDHKRIHSASVLDDPKRWVADHADDYHVIKKLREVIGLADVIVGHNANNFDWKRFMARVVKHRLPPVSVPIMIDTLREARKFKFTSNKLDDLCRHLGLERKMKVNPEIWLKAAQGDYKAIKSMVAYNKDDIPPLITLYKRLRPYMTSHPNYNLHTNAPCCPKCGSSEYQSRGFYRTNVSVFRRYQCNDCAAWFRSGVSIKRSNLR